MSREEEQRLKWVKLYAEVGDAGVVCNRCGISRPTLRKWWRRYLSSGGQGLRALSRRPHRSPNSKVTAELKRTILQLRSQGKGARRIQSEMRLHQQAELSLATIHKILKAAQSAPLIRSKRRLQVKRYARAIPGERIQMDTMKVAPGAYQYTALDDCSRFRVLGLYPRATGKNTLLFLDRVIEEMPFPIQRIQTDRGGEFFAEDVQRRLMAEFIKFRPIAPRSPHLNGKVERSQLTDRVEFWSIHSAKEVGIEQRLEEWQFDYNWRRPHGSLGGATPAMRSGEMAEQIPLREVVALAYDLRNERMRYRDWKVDQAINSLRTSEQSVNQKADNGSRN